MHNKAVVVGALGVIGRYIAERLVEEPDWQVVGLSRRKASDGPRYNGMRRKNFAVMLSAS